MPAFAFSPVSSTSTSLRGLLMAPRSFQSSAAALMPEKLTIVVPSMGDSIVEGTICSVLKAQGDSVAEDEVIAQIETDKVTVDVRAPKSGVISSVSADEGTMRPFSRSLSSLLCSPGEPCLLSPPVVPKDAEAPKLFRTRTGRLRSAGLHTHLLLPPCANLAFWILCSLWSRRTRTSRSARR